MNKELFPKSGADIRDKEEWKPGSPDVPDCIFIPASTVTCKEFAPILTLTIPGFTIAGFGKTGGGTPGNGIPKLDPPKGRPSDAFSAGLVIPTCCIILD